MKKIGIVLSLVLFGAVITVFSIGPLRSQIMEISGLAVAQTDIKWNKLKDAAVGDAQTTGLAASGLYYYDPIGATWNRVRGDTTNGLKVSATLPETALLTNLNAVVAIGVGATSDLTTYFSKYTWTIVIAGGTLTALTVNLEGSIDNITFFSLDTSTAPAGEMRHVVNKPIRYVRGNVTVYTVAALVPTVTMKFIGGGN